MGLMSAILLNLGERKQNLNKLKKTALENKETINELTATTSPAQLRVKLSESQQKIDDHLQRIDDFVNSLEDMLSKIEDSIKENQRNEEDMKALCEELKSKEKEFELKIIEQKKEIQELRSKVEVLEREKRTLELGQVTWMFEKYVATFVLPETVKVGLLGCFRHMDKWLQKHAHTTEGQERQKIWSDLQLNSKVTWSADHLDAINDLREERKPLAHPKVNLTQARQEVAITIPNLESECLDIIYMVEKLSSLMMLGKLASEFEVSVINVVYPGAKMDIAGLINWIKLNGASEQGKVKRGRWSKLTNGNEWTKKHEEALKEMKVLKRNIKDLQNVELEKAKMHMIDYVPKELEKECFEIVDIMKRIETLNFPSR